jgi:predicted aspartyl protease
LNFKPQLAYQFRPPKYQTYSKRNPNRPNNSIPEQIEVDKSIRSNKINYGNFPYKRPNSMVDPRVPKLQKIYNAEHHQQPWIEKNDEQEIFYETYPSENECSEEEQIQINFLRIKSSLLFIKTKGKDGKIYKFLIDTGASISAIKPEHAVQKCIKKEKLFILQTLHGQSVINSFIEAPLLKKIGINKSIKFYLIPILKEHDGILGHPEIQNLNLNLNFRTNIISNGKVTFPFFDIKKSGKYKINHLKFSEKEQILKNIREAKINSATT